MSNETAITFWQSLDRKDKDKVYSLLASRSVSLQHQACELKPESGRWNQMLRESNALDTALSILHEADNNKESK